jgi:hypothetical protein
MIVNHGSFSYTLSFVDISISAYNRAKPTQLALWQINSIATHLRRIKPEVLFRQALWSAGTAPVLSHSACPLRELTMHGGRIFSVLTPGSRIVKARILENGEWTERVGELTHFWEHMQPFGNSVSQNYFAQIRWYKRVPLVSTHSGWLWFEQLCVFNLLLPDLLDEICITEISIIC